MGVTGLWKLIEPCGSPVPVENLECKILAVDISIWLHQVVKGFQDKKGTALPNAHLIGLFHRLCKLLYYRVKPIFVFDGCVPQLKRETIAQRQVQRNKLNNEADRLQILLLQALAKEQVVQRALGESADLLLKSPNKRALASSHEEDKETYAMFKLPEIPEREPKEDIEPNLHSTDNGYDDSTEFSFLDSSKSSSFTTEDSSFEESDLRSYYYSNLQNIDVRSEQFKALPADVRREVLIDIKETRKQSSWGRLQELPTKSDDFSKFQMERLRKRRAVQESIEHTDREIGDSLLTYNDLERLFSEEGIVELSSVDKDSKRICSDESTRFLLIRDLKKNSTSTKQKSCEYKKETHWKLGTYSYTSEESDSDLELAIALSLEQCGNSVKEETIENNEIKSNSPNFNLIKNSYIEANSNQLIDEVEKPQNSSDQETDKAPQLSHSFNKETTPVSDDDDDFKEVPEENEGTQNIYGEKEVVTIAIDLNKAQQFKPQDDLFSDIFFNKMTEAKPALAAETNIKAALEELKNQANSISNIKLDDIKLNSIIELSDDDILVNESLDVKISQIMPNECSENHQVVIDTIEISDDHLNRNELLKSAHSKAPIRGEISDYFQTEYTIRRTPEKRKGEDAFDVKSPYLGNRTPQKTKKRSLENSFKSPTLTPKMAKGDKSDFSSTEPNFVKDMSTNVLDSSTHITAADEDVLDQAASLLKENKSTDELKDLALRISEEKTNLESERNRQDRMGTSISQRMSADCQELLRLFGIPYIVAPMEAEAQCAFLDAINLTNGTITDDSDIWLFGGRTVYKNFFAQDKHVLEFRADKIEKTFNCDRVRLIQLACLVGSDYTKGIHGIGTVTAMEILATFSSKKESVVGKTDPSITEISSTLSRFRDWWRACKSTAAMPSNSVRLTLLKKLRNIELHEGFPNSAVIEAYLKPKIDESKEAFTWGQPNLDSIRDYTRKYFGWNRSKADNILKPVIKKINERKSQTSIKNYFAVKSAIPARPLKISRRVQSAISKMSSKLEAEPERQSNSNAPRHKRKALSKKQHELLRASKKN